MPDAGFGAGAVQALIVQRHIGRHIETRLRRARANNFTAAGKSRSIFSGSTGKPGAHRQLDPVEAQRLDMLPPAAGSGSDFQGLVKTANGFIALRSLQLLVGIIESTSMWTRGGRLARKTTVSRDIFGLDHPRFLLPRWVPPAAGP